MATIEEARAAAEQRQTALLALQVPADALAAYRRYGGDKDSAWKAEDETGWALIQQYRDAIEWQGLAGPGAAVIQRMLNATVAAAQAAEEEARAAAAAAAEQRQTALLGLQVPADALAAYRRYQGNKDSAWKAEDETAWALIQQYRDAIEWQGLGHPDY